VITAEEDPLSERKRIVRRDLSIYLNWLTVQYVCSILPLLYGIHRSHDKLNRPVQHLQVSDIAVLAALIATVLWMLAYFASSG
jgi:hypothetical protein